MLIQTKEITIRSAETQTKSQEDPDTEEFLGMKPMASKKFNLNYRF